ncbi:Metallo-dependent phosphatase-like protein [Syncephalastrum racemosum]|uniref:Purple acid phosphatase n=1 Tax=Syncephalastrum racemosum TaxID=13706 RepID=A0A1X2H566_SYNRA|nr:Metallo-dependent phosphatase-like protein [Syncephalastrum racemosum]
MRLTFAAGVLSLFSYVCHASAEAAGSPGVAAVPDKYNTLPGVDWNRTYAPTEPQQIHLSFGSESKYARVQFATLEQVDKAILRYWPKSKKNRVSRYGKDWAFVDGGAEHRTIYLHDIKTENLKPATIYSYQVGAAKNGNTTWSSVYEFHTASKHNTFEFLAIADIGINNAVALPQIIKAAESHKYDFLTLSGDQAYNMDDFNGLKGDEYMNLLQEVYAKVPYMGVPGNHEGAYNFSHYKNRFANLPFEESKSPNSLLYSFNYKSLHLVSFSTEVYLTGTEDMIETAVNWLNSDLEKANKQRDERPFIVVITHHPLYCSSQGSDCTTTAKMLREGPLKADNVTRHDGLEPILLKHKVDMLLTGHVHNYERTYPVANDSRTAESYKNAPSYMQVITGNAGQPEGGAEFTSGPYKDWSAVRYSGYGFSTVRVSPTELTLTHHEAKKDGSLGRVIDEFTISK